MRRERQEKLDQLNRILQSEAFAGSESLKVFLRFIVNAALDNQGAELKEYTIAHEVFGNNNYDPRIDSTVRVQAGRLRAKLQEYYANEGKSDKWVVDLPKGHYIPVFAVNQSNNVATADASLGSGAPNSDTARVSTATFGSKLSWVTLSVAVLALALSLLAWHYRSELLRERAAQGSGGRGERAQVAQLSLLWKELMVAPRPILIVYSNTLFGRGGDERLAYLKPLESGDEGNETADQQDLEIIDHYTGVGEVMGVACLSRMFTELGQPFRVKRSLLLAWDDVKTENVVILGSPHENHFLRKLPQRQSFVFDFDLRTHVISLVNLRPRPGEPKVWSPKIERSSDRGPAMVSVVEDYALVSLLKGLGENNRLLLLAGTTTFATHAAAEYVSNPESVKELISRVTPKDGRQPSTFEAILKVRVNDGVPVQTTLLTHHLLD